MPVEEVVGSGKDSHIWFVGRDTYNQNKDLLLPPWLLGGKYAFFRGRRVHEIKHPNVSVVHFNKDFSKWHTSDIFVVCL